MREVAVAICFLLPRPCVPWNHITQHSRYSFDSDREHKQLVSLQLCFHGTRHWNINTAGRVGKRSPGAFVLYLEDGKSLDLLSFRLVSFVVRQCWKGHVSVRAPTSCI